ATYMAKRIAHWDQVALRKKNIRCGRYYHKRLTKIYQFLVYPGQRVCEIGCGEGDLLAALKPSVGVGVDFSKEMIRTAQKKHPHLTFIQADCHDVKLDETFDVVIFSDLLNDLFDVQRVFQNIRPLVHPRTRIIINSYSRLWEKPLSIARRLRLSRPTLPQNWFTVEDILNMLRLSDYEVIRKWEEIVFPLPFPLLSAFFNRFLVKIWPFRLFALANFILAKPVLALSEPEPKPSVSVLVPARNEAGNIANILRRVPEMGSFTEIIFVEGHSKDDTYKVIEQEMPKFPDRRCRLIRQTGIGKADAVRAGFKIASGDILMILDADITVPPEDLPRFYEALVSGKGEFINGVRLVYPMEDRAMRFFNILGNKFFSVAFSWLLGQSIKDTLCGTKVLKKDDYLRIADNRAYFGEFDPFGDYDLIFGASKLGLKIVDLPIRYRERVYGSTNIQRWRHGLLLLKMLLVAARRIKFV
ncbi:MAG: glycosyltransferase, partial [Acidobacteriota bacterium]